MPLVLFDRAIPELDVDAVTGDDRDAAITATRYLIAQGHRRLAYVSAMDAEDGGLTDIGRISNSAVRERVEGFVSVLTEAGLPNPLHYIRLGATNHQQTDSVIKRLLSEGSPPTALLASDSLVGLRIFKSLQSLGLSIPKDVSMISFLDADWTSVTVPPITIVDQRVYEMGKLVTASGSSPASNAPRLPSNACASARASSCAAPSQLSTGENYGVGHTCIACEAASSTALRLVTNAHGRRFDITWGCCCLCLSNVI